MNAKFELLDEKVEPYKLKEGDHIMLNDMLYRVVNNFPVIGGGGRMLMLAYHAHLNPTGYKFEPIATHGPSFQVFREIE